MTPAEAAAAIEAMKHAAMTVQVREEPRTLVVPRAKDWTPRSVQLRQAFDQAAREALARPDAQVWPQSLEGPPVYVMPAPGIDAIVRRRLNALDRPARTARRKAQRRARRITRLHRKG